MLDMHVSQGRVAQLDRVSASEADTRPAGSRRPALNGTVRKLYLAYLATGLTPVQARGKLAALLQAVAS